MGAGPQPNFIQNSGAVLFAPTIDFAVHGDLTVAYANQQGVYSVTGNLLCFNISLTFTPTYTTASGNFQAPLPPIVPTSGGGNWNVGISRFTSPTWPGTSPTQLGDSLSSGSAFMLINATKSGSSITNFSATQIVSGVQYILNYGGSYPIG